MNKIGNNYSKIVEAAISTHTQPEEKTDFATQILETLKKANQQQTLNQVLAQLENRLEPISNDMPTNEPSMSLDTPGSGLGEGVEGDLGGVETDIEGAKNSLVEALISLCGGPEEAKQCIDASAVGPENDLDGQGIEPGVDDMSGPSGGPVDEFDDIPAPMPMIQ